MGYRDIFYPAADGLVLHARDYSGQQSGRVPILCLPGLTRNARDFDGVAEQLAADRRVIVAEQRGRGESAWDPNPVNYQPTTYVTDMASLLDHLAIARVVIVGTSLGGLMAMLMAATQPQHVAAIVLNDIGPEVSEQGIRRIRDYVARQVSVHTWADAVADIRAVFADAYPDYGQADWERAARAIYRESAGRPVLDYDPEIGSSAQRADAVPDLWPVFAACTNVPMLVLRGERSEILAAGTVSAMRERHSSLRAVEVPLRGHAPTMEEPVAAAALAEFIASIE